MKESNINKQPIVYLFRLALLASLTLNSMAAKAPAATRTLPYDRTCPVIYDNDYANDYVDWYLMALAGAGPPAISILRKDYVRELKRVSFGGWKTADGHEVPMFKDDPKGRALVVTKVDAGIATEEWWRALKNPVLWQTRQ